MKKNGSIKKVATKKKLKTKPRKDKKVPYVVYVTPNLKSKIKAYAKKKDLFLTDVAEALLSRGLHAN